MHNSRLRCVVVLALSVAAPAISQESFGPNDQMLLVQAREFDADGDYRLISSSTHGFLKNYPSTQSYRLYWAPLRLPPGALIRWMRCYLWDDGDDSESTVALEVHGFNTVSDQTFGGMLGWLQVTGGGGFQEPVAVGMDAYSDSTVRIRDGNTTYDYVLRLTLYATDLFRHCEVTWRRTVKETGLETYADVPSSDERHDHIEALTAAGITAGCGGDNFCPDAPVTRGQLAVFLAKALGLHYAQ